MRAFTQTIGKLNHYNPFIYSRKKVIGNHEILYYLLGVARRSFHCGRTLQDKKAASPSFNAEAVSQQLGVSFKTPNILQRALTHKSYEHGSVPSNERLAYLGARVLQLSACESGLTSSSLQDHVQEHTNLDRLAKKFDGLNLADGMQYHVVM